MNVFARVSVSLALIVIACLFSELAQRPDTVHPIAVGIFCGLLIVGAVAVAWDLLFRSEEVVSPTHAPCCGCGPADVFVCPACGRLRGFCQGAYDEMPNVCDDCWFEAQRGRST